MASLAVRTSPGSVRPQKQVSQKQQFSEKQQFSPKERISRKEQVSQPSVRRRSSSPAPRDLGMHLELEQGVLKAFVEFSRKRIKGSPRGALYLEIIRRRPTLPGGIPPSTIGADRLNFRVRNGNGWDPVAMVTGNLLHKHAINCLRKIYSNNINDP